jgi:hypothetical protein
MWRIPSTDLFELNSGHLILLLKSIAKSCEFQGGENYVNRLYLNCIQITKKPLKSLRFQGLKCGKQDLKRLGTIILKQYKCQKALFFNGFCQFEKIWKNHKKRQLHSQLHSNCIQRMAVLTLQRTTTCSSSMTVLFYFFAHDGCFIGLRSGYDCARNACTEGCPKTPVYKAFPGLYPGTNVPCLGGTFLLLYPGTYPRVPCLYPGTNEHP